MIARSGIRTLSALRRLGQVVPPLSSIHVHIAGFGRRTSELVLDGIGQGVPPPDALRLPVSLAARRSTVRA